MTLPLPCVSVHGVFRAFLVIQTQRFTHRQNVQLVFFTLSDHLFHYIFHTCVFGKLQLGNEDNYFIFSIAALEEDDDDDDDDGEECEGRKRLQVSAHQASHTNYLLMRGYSYPGIDFPPLDLTKYGPSLLPPVLTRNILSPSSSPPTAEECERRLIQDGGYTAQDIEACAQIRRSLQEAGEKGLDARDLHRSHVHLLEPQSGRTRSLQQYLQVKMCIALVMLMMGRGSLLLKDKVDQKEPENANLVMKKIKSHSFCNQDHLMLSEFHLYGFLMRLFAPLLCYNLFFCVLSSNFFPHREKLSFISRPWRFIDGKVNRSVCKGILEAVLYHIMSRPGLTQQALLGHYKDTLQPLAVLEMVQALIDIGCVTKRTLVKQPKPSLFSRSAPTDSGTSGVTEEPDTVFYEPTISCCLRLCRVLPNDRHWNEC
uniref:Uncharacterized protein n=1 Tax=Cyprinodon variegatus TaxID=28743 RepID=A0A3Q2CRD4_CYPVA